MTAADLPDHATAHNNVVRASARLRRAPGYTAPRFTTASTRRHGSAMPLALAGLAGPFAIVALAVVPRRFARLSIYALPYATAPRREPLNVMRKRMSACDATIDSSEGRTQFALQTSNNAKAILAAMRRRSNG